MSNEPYSEQYRVAAEAWSKLESAASMLEECKSAILSQRKIQQGDMPDNKAERNVKASPEWRDYIEKMVKAREAANLAKVKVEYLRMKFWEASSENANRRAEMRL